MSNPTIAVIGGGASATLFLAHFVLQDAPPCSITIYDRSGAFGLGIAYATKNPAHLLNVRAVDISGFPDNPKHFVEWLAAHHKKYGPDDFVPRLIYGEYLLSVLEEAKKTAAAKGHDLVFRQENVEGVPQADVVVIATGNDRPLAPPGAQDLTAADGYHADPWSADYAAMAGEHHVVILGTGLSMVDAVLSLEGAGYKGRITAVSKKGLLPAIHAMPRVGSPPLEGAQLPRTARGLLRFVRERIAQAEKENIPWQLVINSLRPLTNTLWLEMSEQEQRRFLRHVMPYWIVHRHRLAPEADTVISKLRREGRLRICSDWVVNIAKGIIVTGTEEGWKANQVINCLGYAASPAPPPQPNIFAIGPALTGTLLETTAIPEVRQTARQRAVEIANFLKTPR